MQLRNSLCMLMIMLPFSLQAGLLDDFLKKVDGFFGEDKAPQQSKLEQTRHDARHEPNPRKYLPLIEARFRQIYAEQDAHLVPKTEQEWQMLQRTVAKDADAAWALVIERNGKNKAGVPRTGKKQEKWCMVKAPQQDDEWCMVKAPKEPAPALQEKEMMVVPKDFYDWYSAYHIAYERRRRQHISAINSLIKQMITEATMLSSRYGDYEGQVRGTFAINFQDKRLFPTTPRVYECFGLGTPKKYIPYKRIRRALDEVLKKAETQDDKDRFRQLSWPLLTPQSVLEYRRLCAGELGMHARKGEVPQDFIDIINGAQAEYGERLAELRGMKGCKDRSAPTFEQGLAVGERLADSSAQ